MVLNHFSEGLVRRRSTKRILDDHMDVSENSGTPKSSILIGFSIINHPFLGTPNFWKHPYQPFSEAFFLQSVGDI